MSGIEPNPEEESLLPNTRVSNNPILNAGRVKFVSIVTPFVYGDIEASNDNTRENDLVDFGNQHGEEHCDVRSHPFIPPFNGKVGAFNILLLLCCISVVTTLTTYLTPQVSTVSNAHNSILMIAGIGIVIIFRIRLETTTTISLSNKVTQGRI